MVPMGLTKGESLESINTLLYLYPQLLQLRRVHVSNHASTCRAGVIPGSLLKDEVYVLYLQFIDTGMSIHMMLDVHTTRYKLGMSMALYTDETQCDTTHNTQWMELMACHFYCALSLVTLEIATG